MAKSCSLMVLLTLYTSFWVCVNANFDYKDALKKSIIFLEAQRSGKLPKIHRPLWRGDSGLDDGKAAGVDLAGGYYDAGDNVKYGFPMAFTVTTLAWAAYFYQPELGAAGEMRDPVKDHECWISPEKMKTPRTVLEINAKVPGTEIAAETAAALAASSMVFRSVDKPYSEKLLTAAKQDELLWGATWLYIATRMPAYLKLIQDEKNTPIVNEFSWDLKFAGVQILLTQLFWQGEKGLQKFKQQADGFVCNVIPESPSHKVFITPGGMIHLRDGANSQYVTSTAFLFSVYSDLLAKHKMDVGCGAKRITSVQVMDFAKKQMDYLLGNNPAKRSMMVGFGKDPPLHAHHRGASVPMNTKGEVNCGMSFVNWYNTPKPNPNELTGAILGGPDRADKFVDSRSNSSCTEPCTYINSCAIGVLAKLAKK
ncbi:hypothetical protein L2E82_50140 [Cichorium intybus]|nr:hypothetical protein L2E82_50140 [Cichorium intybus]